MKDTALTQTSSTPDDDPPGRERARQDAARQTGRGFLVITAAKIWFMITGAITQLGLPLFFGDAGLFGQFKIVTESIGLLTMVMITGTLQAVAKVISEQPERARELVNQALKLQLALGLPLTAAYALASPFVAEHLLHDASLSGVMQLSSLIIAFYAFYALFVGYLNGLKSFVRQAALDIGFQTMKTAGILGLVLLGFGVVGAVSGFVAAAAVIALASGVMVWRMIRRGAHLEVSSQAGAAALPGEDGEAPESRRSDLLTFLLWVMAYTFALNGLLRADLLLIKSLTSVPSEALLAFKEQFVMLSDKFSGFYGAALNISRLPYQGVIAITFVVFPLISEASFHNDVARTRGYIEATFRYCFLLICAVALPLIFSAEALIGALYSPDYSAVAGALSVMTVSMIFFSLFFVAATIITGAGRPGVATLLMAISLGVSALLNGLLITQEHAEVTRELAQTAPQLLALPQPDVNARELLHGSVADADAKARFAAAALRHAPRYMSAAAWATACAMALGCALSMAFLGRRFGAWLPWRTALRVALAALALYGLDLLFPDLLSLISPWTDAPGLASKALKLAAVVARMVCFGLTFLLVLGLAGEISEQDRERVRSVVRRRKRS